MSYNTLKMDKKVSNIEKWPLILPMHFAYKLTIAMFINLSTTLITSSCVMNEKREIVCNDFFLPNWLAVAFV